MARKGNPISVRLDLNRSSDSSRFSDIFASILTLISSIVTKMILSITLLFITRLLWDWGLTWVAPLVGVFLGWLDLLLSFMDGLPLSGGGGSSDAGPSRRLDLNVTPSSSPEPAPPAEPEPAPPAEPEPAPPAEPEPENGVNDPNDIDSALREREKTRCLTTKLQLCDIARAEFQKAEIDFPGLSDRYSKTEVIDHVMRDIVTSEEAIKGSLPQATQHQYRLYARWLNRALRGSDYECSWEPKAPSNRDIDISGKIYRFYQQHHNDNLNLDVNDPGPSTQ